MGEKENLVQTALTVLEGLELMQEQAGAIIDQIAEERAVLEGLLILAGGVSYRQKKGEKGGGKGGENSAETVQIGTIGTHCQAIAR